MNRFLNELFDRIAIDITHLAYYLTSCQKQYLCNNLRSIEEFENDFYSDQQGENLEVLLHFLSCHKKDILNLWGDSSKKEILIDLYTSGIISGSYNCFRFDLEKFKQAYNPVGKELTIYRIGREE